MPNWLERLTSETQVKLLALVRRSPQTVTGLAEALRVTDNGIRTHIATLQRLGLIEAAGTQRDTGGKPARLYALTREGEELFPKAYSLVLGALVEEISRTDGPKHAVKLLRAVGEQLASGVAVPADAAGRVAAAAAALRGLGGHVEVHQTAQGWRLEGNGCALSAVTAKHPQVCSLAKALVEEITDQPVTERCEHSGMPRCCFEIAKGRKART